MTVAGLVGSAGSMVTTFGVYAAIAVAIPLGFALVPRIKRWVTRR